MVLKLTCVHFLEISVHYGLAMSNTVWLSGAPVNISTKFHLLSSQRLKIKKKKLQSSSKNHSVTGGFKMFPGS